MLRRIVVLLIIAILSVQLVGCSTTKNANDPYETLNREVFGFNRTVDRALIKPVAYAYMSYMPSPIQSGVTHFFDNVREVPTVINDFLQFKIALAMHDTSRFLINSTLGIFGLFDPATSLGLEHNRQDFGQTLYHWGYKKTTFIMLPFLGPSTIRDTIGLTTDFMAFSVWPWIESDWVYGFLVLDLIDTRAKYLRHEKILDVIAIDEYLMVRDAYLQHREYQLTGKENGIKEEEVGTEGSGAIEEGEDGEEAAFFEESAEKSSGFESKAISDDDEFAEIEADEKKEEKEEKAKEKATSPSLQLEESKPLEDKDEFFDESANEQNLKSEEPNSHEEDTRLWTTQAQQKKKANSI